MTAGLQQKNQTPKVSDFLFLENVYCQSDYGSLASRGECTMLAELIIQFQKGDNRGAEIIIEKFMPLLKKYAYKLNYEDAYDDIIVDFLALLLHIKLDSLHSIDDGALTVYFQRSIHSFYIKRLATIKRNKNLIFYSDLNEREVYKLESHLATIDNYFENELPGLEAILTKHEWELITLIYIIGYSIKEVADAWGLTKQAVNQLKNRALKKILHCWTTSELRRN
jgi:RNA polymerase sigma factor (sigma-70 family)